MYDDIKTIFSKGFFRYSDIPKIKWSIPKCKFFRNFFTSVFSYLYICNINSFLEQKLILECFP